MREGPAATEPARVPRSRNDDRFVKGLPLPEIRISTAIVVSVDGDTCTVLMFDEEITGVIWLGSIPPYPGEVVQVESRGDLLVIPAKVDTFTEGAADDATHIVTDSSPGLPAPMYLNIGGAMRSTDPWNFDANAHGWHRELAQSGLGIRCWQAAGTLQSKNWCPNPSFETGLTGWESNTVFGDHAVATLTQDAGRFLFGSKSMKVAWPNLTGAQTGSNAVHGKYPLDPAKTYVASLHVYVPEGSPDVRAAVIFRNAGPAVTAREQWVWTEVEFTPPDASGAFLGVTTDTPTVGTMCWVDAVVVREAGTSLPAGLTYFDGSLPATETTSYAWEGTAHASKSLWYNGQVGTPGTGVLWSDEPFDVGPGDTLDLAAVASKTVGADATVQLAVCYSPDNTRDPDTITDPVVITGPGVVVNAAEVPLTFHAVVPPLLPDGISTPARARIGFQLVGAGTSDLILTSATLAHGAAAWGIGSLWLNPSAGQATPTIGSTDFAVGPTTLAWGGSAFAMVRAPLGFKALVTAPNDCGGFIVATYQVSLLPASGQTNNNSVRSAVWFLGSTGGQNSPTVRVGFAPSTATTVNIPVTVTGWAQIEPGTTVECYPTHGYGSDPSTTGLVQIREASLTVMFIPNGAANPATAKPAAVSFWDGDSWRPGTLPPATMDLTKAASTTEAAKTATTTAISKSDGDVHTGTPVTLTAVVTSTAADGTVIFQSSTTSTGPWTSIGSAAILGVGSARKAIKSITTSGSNTKWYRAIYGGSTTYATSTSASTSVRSRTKSVSSKMLNAKWVKAYGADGSTVPAGPYDNAVHQGDVGGGSSNRRSVIGFPQPTITGSEAEVTRVTLMCKDWQTWKASNNNGTLIAGWHESTGGSAPGSYPFDKTHNDKSRHGVGQGSWNVNLTSWADSIVTRSDFGGVSVGPGASMAAEYGGWSNNGATVWILEVTWESWS